MLRPSVKYFCVTCNNESPILKRFTFLTPAKSYCYEMSFLSGLKLYLRLPTTGCVEKMLPIFESKWLIIFSKLRHGFYTIVMKIKFCTEPYNLQLPNVNNSDTVKPPK